MTQVPFQLRAAHSTTTPETDGRFRGYRALLSV